MLFKELGNYLSRYSGGKFHRWMALEVDPVRSLHLDKSHWSETIMADLEFMKVPIPNGYDWILKDHYGDYMKMPPMEQRINHEYLELEPEVPYKQFFNVVGN